MPRYIDANQKVHFLEYDDMRKDFITVEKTIADCLDYNCEEGCPEAADVEEVKHGEWVQNPFCKPITTDFVVDHCRVYYCSECGRHIEDESSRPYEHFPYCHCGAKMDGKESNK